MSGKQGEFIHVVKGQLKDPHGVLLRQDDLLNNIKMNNTFYINFFKQNKEYYKDYEFRIWDFKKFSNGMIKKTLQNLMVFNIKYTLNKQTSLRCFDSQKIVSRTGDTSIFHSYPRLTQFSKIYVPKSQLTSCKNTSQLLMLLEKLYKLGFSGSDNIKIDIQYIRQNGQEGIPDQYILKQYKQVLGINLYKQIKWYGIFSLNGNNYIYEMKHLN